MLTIEPFYLRDGVGGDGVGGDGFGDFLVSYYYCVAQFGDGLWVVFVVRVGT